MIKFKSVNLVYRELEEADASGTYVNWLNDPEINKFLEIRHRQENMVTLKSFLKSVYGNKNEILLGIFRGDEHIGNIKIGPINTHYRHADIGLLIGGRNCRGKGFGTESIYAITKYCFDVLNLIKVEAGCYESNIYSYRGFKKIGYKEEGFLRDHVIYDGRVEGVFRLGMTLSDWRENEVQSHNERYKVEL